MYEQVVEVLRAELTRVSYERNQAEAEIERLRGLLREVDWQGMSITPNLLKRVRETLGERNETQTVG